MLNIPSSNRSSAEHAGPRIPWGRWSTSSIPLKGLLESHGADSGHLRSRWKAPRREQALDCSRRECYQ